MTDLQYQKRIPKDFAAKLEAARAKRSMQGERRVITALFCDVTGSTAMAERLDPEEWGDIMDDAFDFLIAPVYRYEGTVARLMGDAVLAFFGAPIAHEDDPQRALLAGLDMVADIQPFRDLIQREYDLDFNIRVGINTGPVVVGEIGSDLALEYTAMGDAINLAARMEQSAEPGTVQISSHTYKLVAPLFDFEPLGEIELKGKSKPVTAYRLLGRKQEPGRLRGIEGIMAPLIGRGQELERLRKLAAEVRSGSGQIICLIGEAGLGKSRLIQELQASWPEKASWTEVHGVSYDASRPYGLFLHLLRQSCGINEYDQPEIVRQKLNAMIETELPEWNEEAIYAIEMLMTVAQADDTISRPDGQRIEGDALKRELYDTFLRLWHQGASYDHMVMIVDDLHWGDEASVELLLHLCQTVEDLPVMFLCAFRPYRDSPVWQLKQTMASRYPERYTEIVLNPLSNEDSDVLVSSLLSIADLPNQLRLLILQKTEGNPFFIEEVVRTLIDSGAVTRDESGLHWRAERKVDGISIPDNVQALLTARIDRLERDVRRTLQLAAVIGRSFYYRVLKTISDMAAALDEQLETLQRVELISEAARFPELEYMFRHELTRDAANESILHRRRRQFHRDVGQALEVLFPDRLEEEAPRLAYHFYEAGDNERALKYHTMAADTAAGLYANTEAETHYGLALKIARRAPADSDQLKHLYLHRGRALELNADYEQALQNYQEMEKAARTRGDQNLEVAALTAQATVHATPTLAFSLEKGQALSEQALTMARELSDRPSEARVLWNFLLLNINRGRHSEAIAYGEQSLAIARELNLREQLAFTLNDIQAAYLGIGQLEHALTALAEARALWRELGNMPMLADNLANSAMIHLTRGDFKQTLSLAEEALRIGQRTNNLWGQAYGRWLTGYVYWEHGEPQKAISAMEDAIRLSEQGGLAPPQVMLRADLAWVYAGLAAIERGLEMAHVALSKSEELLPDLRPYPMAVLARLHILNQDVDAAEAAIKESSGDSNVELPMLTRPLLAMASGELAMLIGDYEQVVIVMEALIVRLRNFGARSRLPEALHLKGQALMALGRVVEAQEVLQEGREEAEALESRHHLWRTLLELGRVNEQLGQPANAEELRQRAREIVEYIHGHIGSPDLRDSFRSLADVLALIDVGSN